MLNSDIKNVKVNIGDDLRIKTTVIEGGKTRIQTFEGMLIALKGRGENKTMTIRHIGQRGIGVERIWPLNSPSIVGVDVAKKAGKVRRSKLYYVRNLTGRAASRI